MTKARHTQPSAPGRLTRLTGALLARPAATGGGILMLAMAVAIITNALALQPGAHPAPLFRGTRPVPPEEMTPMAAAQPAAEDADSIDDLVARTTGRPRSAVDTGLVAEIQEELKALGYYAGEVDGLTGPMTSAAIVRFEEEEGLDVTGEPTGDVLAALRAGRPSRRSEADVPAPLPPVAPPMPPRARPMMATGRDAGSIPEPESAVLDAGDLPRAEPAVERILQPEPDRARRDPRLAKVQESLDLLGYGPLRPDGLWTPETRDAIRRFEENRGLELTGEINQAFISELVRIGGLSLD